VTTGAVRSVDITLALFPSLPPQFDLFNGLIGVFPMDTSQVQLQVANQAGDDFLIFNTTTTMTPGSLVGFKGGTIVGGYVLGPILSVWNISGGSITPRAGPPPTVPEPTSIAFVLLGAAALLVRGRLKTATD
jgi:hypothetical protein